ncbi:MAG: hypothetical protein ACTJLL_04875, partial [Anaplasma sp.]
GGKLPEDAKQRLANALKSFQAHVRESNEQVVEAFKGLFRAIMKAFQDAAQRVVMALLMGLNGVANLAALQTTVKAVIQEKAEAAEDVLIEAEQQLDQVVQEVNEAVDRAEDLDGVGQVLTNFQESVTVAVGNALGDMNATVVDLEGTVHGLSPEGLTVEQEVALTASKENALEEVVSLKSEVSGQVRAVGDAVEAAVDSVAAAIGQQRDTTQQEFYEQLEREYNASQQDRLKAGERSGGGLDASVEQAVQGLSGALEEAKDLPDQPQIDQQQQQSSRGGGIGR